jgi:hypothetical protein
MGVGAIRAELTHTDSATSDNVLCGEMRLPLWAVRDAAESTPQFGDRSGYQMVTSTREALQAALDIAEVLTS